MRSSGLGRCSAAGDVAESDSIRWILRLPMQQWSAEQVGQVGAGWSYLTSCATLLVAYFQLDRTGRGGCDCAHRAGLTYRLWSRASRYHRAAIRRGRNELWLHAKNSKHGSSTRCAFMEALERSFRSLSTSGRTTKQSFETLVISSTRGSTTCGGPVPAFASERSSSLPRSRRRVSGS